MPQDGGRPGLGRGRYGGVSPVRIGSRVCNSGAGKGFFPRKGKGLRMRKVDHRESSHGYLCKAVLGFKMVAV